MAGHGDDGGHGRATNVFGVVLAEQRLELRVKPGAQRVVADERNGKQQVGELRGLGLDRLPGLLDGTIRRDDRGVAGLSGQCRLALSDELLQVFPLLRQIRWSFLRQHCGEFAQDGRAVLALLVESGNARDKFGERVGVTRLGQGIERFDAILAIQPGPLQQRHVNKLAARRLDEFLVRKPRENVGGGNGTLREEERFLGGLFGGVADGRG